MLWPRLCSLSWPGGKSRRAAGLCWHGAKRCRHLLCQGGGRSSAGFVAAASGGAASPAPSPSKEGTGMPLAAISCWQARSLRSRSCCLSTLSAGTEGGTGERARPRLRLGVRRRRRPREDEEEEHLRSRGVKSGARRKRPLCPSSTCHRAVQRVQGRHGACSLAAGPAGLCHAVRRADAGPPEGGRSATDARIRAGQTQIYSNAANLVRRCHVPSHRYLEAATDAQAP